MNLSFYYNQIPDNASNEDKKLFVLAMSEKLRQSNEWDLLGILLDDFSKRFFFDFEISYKALLGLLDASRYDAAKLHLNYLYNNLNLSFDSSRLVGIFRAASNLGMHDIALNVFNIFEATCSENFLNLSSVSFRLHKASSFGKIKFPNIVSLGENCLPWMLPNRWGLRNQASIVNDNSLFNLGQTSTEKVSLIIEERASRFLSMPNLELFRSDYSVYPKNNLYHYDFNHEQGDFGSRIIFQI